ncbi:DUF3329 domain-containing protein [Viscerimonas tarda]
MKIESTDRLVQLKAFLLREKFLVAIVLLIFAIIYALNIYYPLMRDDWAYTFGCDNKRIAGFLDILRFQYENYLAWGGRSIVHVVVQLLLWFGEGWSDWLNSMAFVVFVLVIYSITNRNTGKSQPAILAVICLLMWFLQGNFGQSVLWITGSGNYLWGCLITLAFLFPLCSYYFHPVVKTGRLRSGIFFIAGIIAGWTNENLSVGLVFFMLVMFFLLRRENKEIPLWIKWAFAGLVTGSVILLAAPGNYVRYGFVAGETNPALDIPAKLLFMLKIFIRYGALPSVIYLAGLIFFSKFKKSSPQNRQAFRLSALFYATAIVAWIVMIASPTFPQRATFGIISYMIVSISLIYANIDFSVGIVRKLNFLALTSGIALFCFTFAKGFPELVMVNRVFDEREQEILKQKEQGIKNIVLHGRFKAKTGIWYMIPKIDDYCSSCVSDDWIFSVYANYYDVESIVIED